MSDKSSNESSDAEGANTYQVFEVKKCKKPNFQAQSTYSQQQTNAPRSVKETLISANRYMK